MPGRAEISQVVNMLGQAETTSGQTGPGHEIGLCRALVLTSQSTLLVTAAVQLSVQSKYFVQLFTFLENQGDEKQLALLCDSK